MTKEDIEKLNHYKECVVTLRCTLADLKLGGLEYAACERNIAALESCINFIENPSPAFEDGLQSRVLRNAGLLN